MNKNWLIKWMQNDLDGSYEMMIWTVSVNVLNNWLAVIFTFWFVFCCFFLCFCFRFSACILFILFPIPSWCLISRQTNIGSHNIKTVANKIKINVSLYIDIDTIRIYLYLRIRDASLLTSDYRYSRVAIIWASHS